MTYKINIFGVYYNIVDYTEATNLIIENALKKKSFGVTALAVHGLITAFRDHTLKRKINELQLVLPDGQPVRWALNSFYDVHIKDRVYGPQLTLAVLNEANKQKIGIYLYGSTEHTLQKFSQFISSNYPNLKICGIHIDRFRDATEEEDIIDIKHINNSGAGIIFVGRGCPRQEYWVANHLGKINAVMIAVGAAFDFYAGTIKQAPKWMQDHGLEWLFRLLHEPKRLWKRYLITNTIFIYLFFKHKLILRKPY
jgi:N-acetylglucosaminyldiphosphoundecaprenol N-acetyl-beta-D-mannosaminyltransferase